MDIQKIKELALANGFSLKEQPNGEMDLNPYVYDFANAIEQAAKAQKVAVPEGFVLVPKEPTGAMVKAGSWNDYAHSLPDNHVVEIYKLMIQAAQEPSVVEIKINWGCSCTKCGASEAIIASTASGALKHGWFHDGDEVKCVECGNTGEMDARGEDSDICWNENEAQEQVG